MRGIQGYLFNPPGQHDWLGLIGSFILNFGAIEIQSYEWLRNLSADGSHLQKAMKKLFNERVQILRRLLGDLRLPPPLNTESEEAWTEATGLAAFRNTIAHSPLMFVWKNREADGEPDGVAILDYKSATGPGYVERNTIDMQTLSAKVDEAQRVASRLQSLLERCEQKNK